MWDMNEIKKMQTDMRESKKNLLMATLAEKHKNTMTEDNAKYAHEANINNATIASKAAVNEATARMYNSEAGKADAAARSTRLGNELAEGILPSAIAKGRSGMALDTLKANDARSSIMETALRAGKAVDGKTNSVEMNPLKADAYQQRMLDDQNEVDVRNSKRKAGIPTGETASNSTPAAQEALKTITPVPGPVITGGNGTIKKYGPLSPSAAKKDKIFN